MAKEDEGQLVGQKFREEWARFKRYLNGMMKAVIPGGKNGPDGPTFADLRTGGNRVVPITATNAVLVEITGTSTGGINFHGGKYVGFILNHGALGSGTHSARLGATNNADFLPANTGMTQGEEVSIWNTFEHADWNSATDTHLLGVSGYAVGLATGVPENVGTNTRQIVIVTAVPSMACDF